MDTSYYIQYHNSDKIGSFPTDGLDFDLNVDLQTLDSSEKNDSWIYTKKSVENAIGQYCFLIVGKTEKIKKYFLWAYFKIESYQKDKDGYNTVNGRGCDFKHPILLNELKDFDDFKHFCGNFGLGFQNIDNHIFHKTLFSFLPEARPQDELNFDFDKNSFLPTEIPANDKSSIFKEGKTIQVSVNRYERNQQARKACIKHHGTKCVACGFDFGIVYGDIAKDFIHIHHLQQLSEIQKEYTVDPIKDLVPVCANCHSVIHLSTPNLTITELKQILKQCSR